MVEKLRNQGINIPGWVPAVLTLIITLSAIFGPAFAIYTRQQILMSQLAHLETEIKEHKNKNSHEFSGRVLERLNIQMNQVSTTLNEFNTELRAIRQEMTKLRIP